MLLPLPDPFNRFAAEYGLRLACDELCAAPRDVLAPLDAAEHHFLVTVDVPGSGVAGVRLIFAVPLAANAAPAMCDVLWWLAGDAWAVERAGGAADVWAATYGYAPAHAAVVRLFACHVRQAAALRTLLGRAAYDQLVALYDAEIAAPHRPD